MKIQDFIFMTASTVECKLRHLKNFILMLARLKSTRQIKRYFLCDFHPEMNVTLFMKDFLGGTILFSFFVCHILFRAT